jgi:peptidoglycan hydrolase-like amidase
LGEVRNLKVLERGPSGRVLVLEIAGTNGTTVLRRDAIRRSLRELPSTLFVLSPAGSGAWRVDGGGFGHGVVWS